eukprot:3740252-Alexandrium_andersonii.AAC.1
MLVWCPAVWLVLRQLGARSATQALTRIGRGAIDGEPLAEARALLDAVHQASFFAYSWRGQRRSDALSSARRITVAARALSLPASVEFDDIGA